MLGDEEAERIPVPLRRITELEDHPLFIGAGRKGHRLHDAGREPHRAIARRQLPRVAHHNIDVKADKLAAAQDSLTGPDVGRARA